MQAFNPFSAAPITALLLMIAGIILPVRANRAIG
jgi:hypothetical protein